MSSSQTNAFNAWPSSVAISLAELSTITSAELATIN